MTTVYTTKHDAIDQEILPALGEHADYHDADAIADDILLWVPSKAGFILRPDVEFWDVVERYVR